jgi:hypothetical protein
MNPGVESKPRLYGKIILQTSTGDKPLGNVTVELLHPGSEEIYHKVFTDSQGYFAFYNIPPGSYDIQITLGEKTMKQQTQGGPIKKRRVNISGQLIRIPDIVVLNK